MKGIVEPEGYEDQEFGWPLWAVRALKRCRRHLEHSIELNQWVWDPRLSRMLDCLEVLLDDSSENK